MLGSPILYLKAMRMLMFQLSGFYWNIPRVSIEVPFFWLTSFRVRIL